MATLTVSVPSATKDWVDKQVKSGGYSDASDFVIELLESERARSELYDGDYLKQIVEEAEASGISDRTVEDIFAEAVATAKSRGTYRE